MAVVTSNLPMIFPLARRIFTPFVSTIRSYTSKVTGNYASGISRSDHIKLEDKNPRRGMGPRSVNPITNFTFTESEERICEPKNPSVDSHTTMETAPPKNTGIMQTVEVRVTEARKSRSHFTTEETFGSPTDFYLVEQARKSHDVLRGAPRGASGTTSKKDKRKSAHFPFSS